jgi:hypothetical protein
MTELPPPEAEAARQSLDLSLDTISTALLEDEAGSGSGASWPSLRPNTPSRSRPVSPQAAEFFQSIAQTVLGRGQALTAFLHEGGTQEFSALVEGQETRPGGIDFGFSDMELHWLADEPPVTPDHTHANASGDPSVIRAFARHARSRWSRLIAERSEAMTSGQHMVCVSLARNSSDHYLGWNGRDVSIHDMLHRVWRSLHLEGRFDRDTYRRATFPSYYLSEAEFRAPLELKTSDAYRSGLRLKSVRIETIRCPHRRRFERSRKLEVFASGLTAAVHSWSSETFSVALEGHADRDAILSALYERFADAIRSRPHRFSMDYVKAYLLMKKKA